ncbi:MAG: bis(5'-nucleosyl)-tetraphosphatase (symmetrical) YqeK [Clostridiales bacterium]|nr:bis(5'-nucleosyl)-tetraphosphatase (symmetrical) YqeK [Clostridiales bacterium]
MELHVIRKKLKKELDKGRYEHTKGVMYTAGCLAMAHGYSVEKAMLAGLLHDCAKCIPNDEKIALCEKNHILISQVEYHSPYLLHAKLGAYLAEQIYEVSDPEILHSIKVHTTGEPNMSLLDKIIYIADYIEPGRDKAPNLEQVRQLAFHDLNACMAEILRDTLIYLSSRGGSIDATTKMTYNFYKQYSIHSEN